MRRIALVIAVVAGVALFLVARGGDDTYRVAAVFDTARGLVPGQQVKIAGARAGRIEKVTLAPGPKARIVMTVDERFAPFGSDATCAILPEGLLSENYVECRPGRAGTKELSGAIPVEQTAVPTSLQDLLNVFSLPTGQRLQVILTELGIATAGRGEDLNALLRRANPALEQTRRTLEIVDGQREQLATAVAQTDRVVDVLAERSDDVRAFVGRSAEVARTTAEHRGALAETVRRLPPLLDATRGGLRSVDAAIVDVTPLLGQLRTAAPGLARLTGTIPRFTRAGTPALRSLARAARGGSAAVPAARPVVSKLRRATARAVPFATGFEALLTSTRDTGGFEGTLRFLYGLANSLAAYDGVSHMVALAVNVFPECIVDPATDGCSAKFDAPGNGIRPANDPECTEFDTGAPWEPRTSCDGQRATPEARARRPKAPERSTPRRQPPRAPGRPSGPTPTATPRPVVPLPKLPSLPALPEAPQAVAEDLLDFLLKP